MRLYKILILLSLSACVSQNGIPKNYDFTPVMIHLDSDKQNDSIGFNLATAIPELLYPRILTGDLAIWTDSKKRAIQGPQKIMALEKIAKRPFVRNKDLFIHQYWQVFKRNFEFGVQGFTFTGETASGSPINYGYIDAPDIISLLKSEYVPNNMNGSSKITYWDAIHSLKYDFNLVQFNKNNFKSNTKVSYLLQYQAIHDPKIRRELKELSTDKTIVYSITAPGRTSNNENHQIFKKINYYVNKNKQTILNATESKYFFENIYKTWTIDHITITENWSKTDYIPFQKFVSLEFFIDQHTITLSRKQMEELDIQINLQGFTEYLSEKRFDFLLERINADEISPQNSEMFYEALLQKKWDKLK